MIRTRLKQPARPNSTRFISSYLDEPIDYGGEPHTRGEAILDMQRSGLPQPCINRWLQGQELAARIRRRRERISVTLIPQPARLTTLV
jgi:hypothetical protein